MNLSRGLFPLSAAICVLLMARCSATASEPWTISSLRLTQDEPRPGLREFAFSEDVLRAGLTRAIAATPRFAITDRRSWRRTDGRRLHCRLELVLARESPSQIVSHAQEAEVGVVVELWRAEGLPRLTAEGVGRVPFQPGDANEAPDMARAERAAAFERALGQALRQALDDHALQLAAIEKRTSELVADLDSLDARRRDYAIRALGERRAREAIDPLIAHLSEDEEPELVLRAAGALGNLGDERAIPALIEAAERESLPAKASLLAIIAHVGGSMAEGYLFTLSTGHPSEDVRRLARLQLDTLEKRGQARPAHAEKALPDAFDEERPP